MKKLTKALVMLLVAAMLLSVSAFAANELTWIRVSIEDDEGGPNGEPYRVYHWDESSHYLTAESPLLVEVVSIINKMYSPDDRTTRLWDFDSRAMKQVMDEGLKAYAVNDTVWQNYVDKYYTDVNPVAGMTTLKDVLRQRDSKLGDLTPNVAHKISFKNDIVGDSKYGVTYTVTVTRYEGMTPSLELGGDHVAYVSGYPDGTVRPEATITRAEVATILYRLMGDASRIYYRTTENSFPDVDSGDWYNTAVSTMAAAGVIKGYTDGTFGPNETISRAEFAAMITRFDPRSAETAAFKGVFKDVKASDWFAPAVELAYDLGWAEGSGGLYRPDDAMSRAEVMTMLNRILHRAVEEEGMLDDMKTWPDNTADKWYYEAVQEATNSHTYSRTDKQVTGRSFFYEQWLTLVANPDWAALEAMWSTQK